MAEIWSKILQKSQENGKRSIWSSFRAHFETNRLALDITAISLSLVSLADRPRLALYCSFVVNGTRCGRALKREGEIKRWQKEWDGRGDREMKRRGIGEKRAKNDRIAAEFPRNSGFRAGMAVARWNIMLSHRLILSSRWKRDRWNSRMSLFPPSSKKGWLIRNIRISSYDVLHSALFVSFSFFFLFCFFLKGERERGLFWSRVPRIESFALSIGG